MTLVTTAERAKRYLTTKDGTPAHSGILAAGDYLATSLTVTADEDENAFVGALDAADFPPLPEAGTWLEQDDIYSYGGQAVIVRQSHTRTEHAPADVPALFLVYRANAGDVLAWVAGESVVVGTLRTYNGTTYQCIQGHVTQEDWQPPNVPALWQVYVPPSETDEWQAGVAYTGDNTAGAGNGDVVTYNGTEYRCLQSHTSQVGWEPPNVPALWAPL